MKRMIKYFAILSLFFTSLQSNPFEDISSYLKEGDFQSAKRLYNDSDLAFPDFEVFITNVRQDESSVFQMLKFLCNVIPIEEPKFTKSIMRWQWWDFVSAFFGVEANIELERHEKACDLFRKFLDLDPSDEMRNKIAQSFIDNLKVRTFHASSSVRISTAALFVVNMLHGKDNLFDPSIITCFPNSELSRELNNNLFFVIPKNWYGEFSTKDLYSFHQPICKRLPSTPKGKQLHWLDIATSPRSTGSTALNFLKRTFEEFLPNVKFEFSGTDILFPPFDYDESNGKFKPIFTHIEHAGHDILNDITFYDGRKAKFDAASEEFELLEKGYDFISCTKAIHHFGGNMYKADDIALAKKIHDTDSIIWVNEDEKEIDTPIYHITKTQQLLVENLLSHLNEGGILFLELCFLHLPTFEFIYGENDDSLIIIQRLSKNKFMIHSKIITAYPQPNEAYPSMEFFLYDDKINSKSRYFYKIGYGFPGLINAYDLNENVIPDLKQLLKEAHLLVYRYQKRDCSPWMQMKHATQAVREGKTIKEVLEVYMEFVPTCEDKSRIVELIDKLFSK